jgi:hypothetical protein
LNKELLEMRRYFLKYAIESIIDRFLPHKYCPIIVYKNQRPYMFNIELIFAVVEKYDHSLFSDAILSD